MTFSQLKAAILEGIGPDAARSATGTSGLDAFRLRQIRNGMLEIQRFIPVFREHHTETYVLADLTENGRASEGALDPGMRPQEFWIVDATTACDRYRLDPYPWASRNALICGDVPDEKYVYTIGPDNVTFLIHPGLTSATELEIVWQGIKSSWADADVMAGVWDDAAAACLAEFLKWKIVAQYDKDAVSRSLRHQEEYLRLRRGLFRDQKENSQK